MIVYRTKPPVSNDALNALFAAAWSQHESGDFTRVLAHSMTYSCAYHDSQLVGFVHVAWDGGIHAFLLNPTVHPAYQRQGIGKTLVQQAAQNAREAGCHWLHVDYLPELHPFYTACGFRPTHAGLINLINLQDTYSTP